MTFECTGALDAVIMQKLCRSALMSCSPLQVHYAWYHDITEAATHAVQGHLLCQAQPMRCRVAKLWDMQRASS